MGDFNAKLGKGKSDKFTSKISVKYNTSMNTAWEQAKNGKLD